MVDPEGVNIDAEDPPGVFPFPFVGTVEEEVVTEEIMAEIVVEDVTERDVADRDVVAEEIRTEEDPVIEPVIKTLGSDNDVGVLLLINQSIRLFSENRTHFVIESDGV